MLASQGARCYMADMRVRRNITFLALMTLLIFLLIIIIFDFLGVRPANLDSPSTYQDTEIHGRYEEPNCVIQPLTNISQLRRYLNTVESPCLTMRQFGGRPPAASDGMKLVCLDCQYNIQPGNCTVLSFGVNNEWGFEDDFAEFNCKVYAFDPTMEAEDHQRGSNIKFYRLGLSNYKGSKALGQMRGPKKVSQVDRYENILERLGLTNTIIDYLKMDIELSELDFFEDMFSNSRHLLKNIRQIGMEVHHKTDREHDLKSSNVYQPFWNYYQLMRCHGFRVTLMYTHSYRAMWREVLWGRIGHCNP